MNYISFQICFFIYGFLLQDNILQCLAASKNNKTMQKVLLISLDGFRWDFDSKTTTPAFDRLKKTGVSTEFVLNVFPTKTLPNHHSIMTGLYPEHHGMIDNSFIDTDTGLKFDNWNSMSCWWNQSVPIWIENQRQGHQSGIIFWPGYRVKFDDDIARYLPDRKYAPDYEDRPNKQAMSLDDQVDLAMSWLSKDNVTFVAMHNDEPDASAHESGSTSEKLKKAIRTVDKFVDKIHDKIKSNNLSRAVNVIYIGDHGHVSTSAERIIYLDDIIDVKNDVIAVHGFTNVFIYTKYDKTDRVYKNLSRASQNDTRFHVFLKKDIPEYFHIKHNSRTSDILVLAQPGWIILKNKKDRPPYLRKEDWKRGEHGYDNMQRDMNPGFFAYGPVFRTGFQKSCIKSVDLYSLMCYILDIRPHNNDGRFERVKPLLKDFDDVKDGDKNNTGTSKVSENLKSKESSGEDNDPITCI